VQSVVHFPDASWQDIDAALHKAMQAFEAYKDTLPAQKALFLEAVASAIEALDDILVHTIGMETHLPPERVLAEKKRTVAQWRNFAECIRTGDWVEAIIDTAQPERLPVPRPDIRRMLHPLGPVVVFGASNFPLAYSTAGGDTASALAAGCPVIIKAHPAHPATSALLFETITKAAAQTGMPDGLIQHLYGRDFAIGKALVQHPLTAAIGFTGSHAGGKALYDWVQQRPEPIPFFAEMGSLNPVLLLPEALEQEADTWATRICQSVTTGMGQFCTKPGLLLLIDSPAATNFIARLNDAMQRARLHPMLHEGIADAFVTNTNLALACPGVSAVGRQFVSPVAHPSPVLAIVNETDFIAGPGLQQEVFGPFTLLVCCSSPAGLLAAWQCTKGQLTTSLIGTDTDFAAYPGLLPMAAQRAGRVIVNGLPTGVEIVPAMVHGGPYPATTDSRYSAVGITAINRWARPVGYQNCPDQLLPNALKAGNPLGIRRKVNGEWE
jgi:2,5-dioxopentanoate dehydrogenase